MEQKINQPLVKQISIEKQTTNRKQMFKNRKPSKWMLEQQNKLQQNDNNEQVNQNQQIQQYNNQQTSQQQNIKQQSSYFPEKPENISIEDYNLFIEIMESFNFYIENLNRKQIQIQISSAQVIYTQIQMITYQSKWLNNNQVEVQLNNVVRSAVLRQLYEIPLSQSILIRKEQENAKEIQDQFYLKDQSLLIFNVLNQLDQILEQYKQINEPYVQLSNKQIDYPIQLFNILGALILKDENYILEWQNDYNNFIYFPLDKFLLNMLQIQIIERLASFLQLNNIQKGSEMFQGPIFLIFSRFLQGSILFYQNRQILTQFEDQLNIQWLIDLFVNQVNTEIENLTSRGYMFTMAGRIALRTLNGIHLNINGLDACILVLLDNFDGDKCNQQEKVEILTLMKLMIQNIYGIKDNFTKEEDNLKEEIKNTLLKYQNEEIYSLNIQLILQILNRQEEEINNQQQNNQIQEPYNHLDIKNDEQIIKYLQNSNNQYQINQQFLTQLNLSIENVVSIEYFQGNSFEKLYYIKYQTEQQRNQTFAILQDIIQQQNQQDQIQIITYLFENPKYIQKNFQHIFNILTSDLLNIDKPVMTQKLTYSIFNKYLPQLCHNVIDNCMIIDVITKLSQYIESNKLN